MPGGAVYVGRPTKWGNPFTVGKPVPKTWLHFKFDFGDTQKYLNGKWVESPAEAVRLYKKYALPKDCSELKGKDLACFCPVDSPCHADVLLEKANKRT